MTTNRRITRIRFLNYRGIALLDTPIAERGAIAVGGNEKGKTTFLRGIRAAIEARDIAPDAIRIGSDRSELLIDWTDVSVRRVIGGKKSTVAVREGDGDYEVKPKAYLTDLFGASPLDPLDIFTLKGPERRAKVLKAMPLTTTLAELRTFAPDLPDDFDCAGHGLEVIERARKRFYEERTEANRKVKDATASRDVAEAAAAGAVADDGSNLADATRAVDESRTISDAIVARQAAADAAASRSTSTRARIEALRKEADDIEPPEPVADPEAAQRVAQTLADLQAKHAAATEKRKQLEDELARARAEEDAIALAIQAVNDELAASAAAAAARQSLRENANRLRAQARELEDAIGAAISHPTEKEIADAMTAAEKALHGLRHAQAVEDGRGLRAKLADARKVLADAAAKADRLDAAVKALTNEAPSALLTRANAFPGLSVDDDEVLVNGVRLDAMSGSEQMRFAIDISRRLSPKTKLHVVDGLERLDPTHLDTFIELATSDGWQLLATRVTDGELAVEAILHDESEVAAE